LLLYHGDKDEHVRNAGYFLGYLSGLKCPVIKVSGKLQQPNSDRTANGPDSSGMKVWVTPQSRNQDQLWTKGIWNEK